MRNKMYHTVFAMVLIGIFIPMSVFAQNKDVKIEIHRDVADSVNTKNYYSTVLDVNNIDEMHKTLDSIFSTLDKDMNKKIRVMAFNPDSVFDHIHYMKNLDFDFNGSVDSILSMSRLSTNDKRVEELLKSSHMRSGKHIWVLDEDDLRSSDYNNMNIEVLTDSVTENGKTLIRKEMIVTRKGTEEPIVIKKIDESGNAQVIAFNDKGDLKRYGQRIVVEKNDMLFKPSNSTHDHIEEIKLRDAEILVKGGISEKVIVAPVLVPLNVLAQIQVKEEFGKKIKTVSMSMSFEEKSDLQIVILDREGHILFDETSKNFKGRYTKDIEMNDALSPYYFVAIRDKKMFGRLLKE